MLLSQGSEQGTIKDYENEIIQNVFEFNDIDIEQLCTHRIDVIQIDVSDPVSDWERLINETRHTFYPVFRDNTENIIGILDTKDFFRLKNKSKKNVLAKAVDEPYYVPAGMKANILFNKMQNTRKYFAVIIDEYGGIEGIITLHDLVEALVGEIYEVEEGVVQKDIIQLDDDSWRIKGSADISDVSEVLGIDLTNEDYDTFNGYVCYIIQRIPNDGEAFECETDELTISVRSVKNHIIRFATVTKKPVEENENENA